MKPCTHVLIAVFALGLLLAACGGASATPSATEPAQVEPIAGSEFSRVTLSERAAERLDIQTAPVRETDVDRTLLAGGEVEAIPESEPDHHTTVWVRVPLSEGELNDVARGEPARVFAIQGDEGGTGLVVQPVGPPLLENALTFGTLLYVADADQPGLAPGQSVRIELPLTVSGANRLAVPYASVIYGPTGATWTYTSVEPLVFVRHSITIDYIDGDVAVLLDGPPVGTKVVTVGAAELYGAELGLGQ